MPVLLLFVFALLLRLLFQAATPDGGPCWHIGFQGDAPVWQDLAARAAHGVDDLEFRLPWRPPGMTWGIALLCNGEGESLWWVRHLFTVLGAAIPPVLWLVLRRSVEAPVALLAAGLCAVATNLMLLSSGLHVETLYLLCVLLSLFDQQRMGNGGGAWVALRWGLLHGLLCLLRAEHVLAFFAFLFVAWRRGARVRVLLLAVAASAVVLVPWQVHGNRQVAAFNAGPQPQPPLPPSALPWDADAVAAVRALPAFQQGPVHQFVTETVRVRGGTRVRAEDLGIVREAYGVHPEPLRPAFVALQGAMDFWLGNTPEAAGGFSRKALDRPPQLLGGESRYPPGLRGVLPRGSQFSLNYPPHLDAFVNGYRRGFAEIVADPVAAAGRVVQKVWYALEGATGGIGGHALPIGLSGVRRPVDMVTATGTWPFLWRVLVLCVAAAGLWRLRRVPVLWPLLAFAAVRLVVVAAFFGYARQGALCLPVVAIGVASAMTAVLARWIAGRTAMWLGLGFAVGLCVVEIVRANTASVAVDGRPWLGSAGGQAQFEPHTITFR